MSAADDLELLAAEELAQAASLSWRQLASLIPWGDTYEGISPANVSVHLSRSYLWAGEPGGDILCEVRAYLEEAQYETGARRSALIRRP